MRLISSRIALVVWLGLLVTGLRAAEPASPSPLPLRAGITRAVDALKANDRVLLDRFAVPDEDAIQPFCEEIIGLQKEAGLEEYELRKVLEDMEKLKADRQRETPRWQANYDFVRARLERRIARLANYNCMLGRLRREIRGSGRKGNWQLVAVNGPAEDREVQRLANESRGRLERLARQHKGTPWEMLARRELLSPIKLQWQFQDK